MRILIIGNGGREHTLAWLFAPSAQVSAIYVAPGNGGTNTLPKTQNVPISVDDLPALCHFAQAEQIDLTVVGPEAPLVAGVVDLFMAAGLTIFGPTQAAAQLEGSKAFAKEFMMRHQIPTGKAVIFNDFDEAMRYLRDQDDVPVVKASGLAAGKGVILPDTLEGAAAAVQALLIDRRFGEASDTVLLEERLHGPELSVLAFCDGERALVIPTAQDHKRLLDNDRGPNTGGMGAFSPSPLATPQLMAQIEREILQPTLAGMAAEGMPYKGVLYAGLMLTEAGPKVIEFNCRLGDPETQAILPLLQSDGLELFLASIAGDLRGVAPRWSTQSALTVVMAAPGYPAEYDTGVEIKGVSAAETTGAFVFHAGTKVLDGRLVTAGGRVLSVTALGKTLAEAANVAYRSIKQIEFNGAHYRKDIARLYR